jgi:hypothetical protein
VCAFFADLHTYGIKNVALTPALGDWGAAAQVGCANGCPQKIGAPPQPTPACSLTPVALLYSPTLPYGEVTCSPTPPYTQWYSCTGSPQVCTCQNNAGYPANENDNLAYNCSPSNPIFAGWQNIYNAINAVLAAAKQNSLTVFELDVMNEMDTVLVPVVARCVVDNAQTQTGNPDLVSSLRYYMGYWGFDEGRVVWDDLWDRSSLAGYNCEDVYDDYARAMKMDSVASAVGGGVIGVPYLPSPQNGLYCGGSVGTQPPPPQYVHVYMFQMPVGHAQPDIVDVHDYPSVQCPAGVNCALESNAQVSSEAQIDFTDIVHFMALVDNSSALFMVGETWSNTNNSGTYGSPNGTANCEGGPLDAASQTVTGYNASTMAGHSTVFRPWLDLATASAQCYNWNPVYSNGYPANQQVNPSNQGPYTPTQP